MAEKKKTSKDRAKADEASPSTDAVTDVDLTSEDASPDQETATAEATADSAEDTPSTQDGAEEMTADGAGDAPQTDEPVAQDTNDDSAPEKPAEPSSMVTTEQVVVREGGFWSMVLGGIVAAGVGALAAPYILPEAWFSKGDSALEARIEQGLGAQDQRINALNAQIDGLAVPPDRVDEINGLGETLTALTGQISGLEERIIALESRPAAPSGGGAPIAELEELRTALDAQRAEIQALSAEAQAQDSAAQQSALAALRRAAMTRILTALDSGSDFAPALADLRETGADVPDALADVADTGVPTLPALMETFPAAARSALAAARADSDQGTAGIGSFFKNQLGVRSLLPREGDDPDAVLSRIEAAVGEGRLGDAMAEIETLPEVAQDKLSGWAADVSRRKEAVAAAEALADTLN
ncbi:hypothetical protein ROG8370_03277 [Roseovarius gaetbuli]|uniref:Mitochondrial inner membrane protein n=1 Tax=Roseovarius gaetbuli TaxID=1356575 RepID=A0A1X7A3J5_9RHOB|nr:hypothetical protein [Roseovarius gaetbuli]SLN69416.1 hypothetical protein ROG8370_03277 [Roseovarius gaetbuli]